MTGHAGPVPYDPTIYRGSAAHYRYGRPPYPPELEAVLTKELGLDGNGRLLDAGCGPGILTVRFSRPSSRRQSASTPTSTCSPKELGRQRRRASPTSAGLKHWRRTCPGQRQGRTDWSPSGSHSNGPTSREWPRTSTNMLRARRGARPSSSTRWLSGPDHTVQGHPDPPRRGHGAGRGLPRFHPASRPRNPPGTGLIASRTSWYEHALVLRNRC